ncbi:hypothetical protein EG68_03266 [Paragonimus skrjabini miyazakii]|uniref:Ion transport domain-containing protein n=1 Tax=Paragonimus skrjabini miyazakii TaxID=59628 RepID=A0A8S9ZAH1_9TREM|nr:hypothetical protein EG68_03266 [Paragonimus skrjabini miyazakii]
MAELTWHPKKSPEYMKDTFALLLKYSLQGRTRDLQRLIESKPAEVRECVNRLNNAKLTAMHYAARNGQLGCLKLLVEKAHADVNAEGLQKATPLHFASRFCRKALKPATDSLEVTSIRQSYSPKAPAVDQEKSIPVSIGDASLDDIDAEFEWSDSEEPVAVPLLDNLSLPPVPTPRKLLNGQSENGWTALHYASVRGNEIATKQLLQEPNIDFEIPDRDGMRPLHWAALRNEMDIVTQLLIAKANLYARTKQGNLPMHFACATGNLKLIQLLISVTDDTDNAGCPLQLALTNQDGELPIHWAAANGRTEVVKYCLEHFVDPNLTPATGETCLHVAARVGCLSTVKLLLSNNVNIDTEDMLLQTALHKAAELNNVEVVQLLLEGGADMENQDYNAYTPLLLAACKGHVQVVRILIDAGADLFAQELNSKGIVYLCAEENQTEVLELIMNQAQANHLVETPNINSNFPLHVAAKKGHIEVVKLLVKHGANVTAKNEKERTALHYAAKYGQYKICRLLLKMIPSLVSEFDDDGNLAIHLAASRGHRDVTELLLASGAPIDARNTLRMTPLDWAIPPLHLACKYGHVSTVKILISWGADPAYRLNVDENIPNCGPNALDIAIDNGQRQCAFALLREAKWEQTLRNQTIGPDGLIQTPMRKLIIHMPDVAQFVLDRCVQIVYSREAPPKETYIFEFLDDTYAHWSTDVILKKDRVSPMGVSPIGFLSDKLTNIRSKELGFMNCSPIKTNDLPDDQEPICLKPNRPYTRDTRVLKNNHPLRLMVQYGRLGLLEHRLVTTLINHKWTRPCIVYYTNLIVYAVYLIFYSIYVLKTKPVESVAVHNANSLTWPGNQSCQFLQAATPIETSPTITIFAKYTVLMFAILNLGKELFQLFFNGIRYLTLENLMELTIFSLAILSVMDHDDCYRELGVKPNWQWQCAAVGIFLSWLNLLLFLRRIPLLGIFVLMFTVIMRTFAKFSVVFFLFILAFAFGFYTVLSNHAPFNSFGNSLLKTTVMMLGELEFDATFNEYSTSHERSDAIFFSGVTYALFVTFLIVMSIVIMNLLVGLAVDDIKGVQNEATIQRLAMQIQLILDIESLLPHWLRRYLVTDRITVDVEEPSDNHFWASPNRWVSQVRRRLPTTPNIQHYHESDDEDTRKFQTRLRMLEERISHLQAGQENLLSIINRLHEQLQVWHQEPSTISMEPPVSSE